MSEHPNVARYWRVYEAFSKGDADTIREMLADDLVWHVPGRHRFSGDRNKAETMALFEEVVPEFSATGEPVITTFSIEVEQSSPPTSGSSRAFSGTIRATASVSTSTAWRCIA